MQFAEGLHFSVIVTIIKYYHAICIATLQNLMTICYFGFELREFNLKKMMKNFLYLSSIAVLVVVDLIALLCLSISLPSCWDMHILGFELGVIGYLITPVCFYILSESECGTVV